MEACRKLRGEKDTFVIHISRSESGAWQGNMVWIDEGCEQRFESLQEMLQLMDSTVSDNERSFPHLVR